jgi:hypothetical protein
MLQLLVTSSAKETYNRVQAAQSGANGKTAETGLGDGGIDDSLFTKSIQETLGHLVGTVVLRNLLTQDKDFGVGLELLSKGLVQGLSDGVLLDTRALSIFPALLGAEEDGSGNGPRGLGECGSGGNLDASGSR